MQRKRKYQISFNDESRLQTIWKIKLTLPKLIVVSSVSLILILSIAIGIIMLTPLKTLLPGYMNKSQRIETIEAIMRLDSMQMVFNQNNAYLNNLLTIYDTERTPIRSNITDTIVQKPSSDSLITRTKEEAEFIKMMEEREKYNISILAPLAAEGMIFTMPADDGIVVEDSKTSTSAKIIIPKGSGINNITDGTIISTYFNHSDVAYTIIIQHNNGFISEYSGLGQPIVEQGNNVSTGQRIALYPNTKGNKNPYITLKIWRNGMPLIPYDYIKNNNYTKTPIIDEEVGRGK